MMQSFDQIDEQVMGSVNTMLAQSEATEETKRKALQVVYPVITRSVNNMKQQMSWKKLEPEFTKLYKETFTEGEV